VLFSALATFAQDDTAAEPFAFEGGAINEGLPVAEPPIRLDTPRAAQALNLSGLPEDERAVQGPNLAMMLAYLLLRHDLIDWSEVPDQPDARVLPDVQSGASPYSRRAIHLGDLELDGRSVPISLQRFNVEGAEPVWLFAPFAVERISGLYTASRPGLLSEWITLHDRIQRLGQPALEEWLIVALTLIAGSVANFVGI